MASATAQCTHERMANRYTVHETIFRQTPLSARPSTDQKCQNKGAEYCNVDALVYVDGNCYSLANIIIFAIIAKSTTFPGSIVLSVCCVLCAHDTISDIIFKSICFQFIQLCSPRLFLFVRESWDRVVRVSLRDIVRCHHIVLHAMHAQNSDERKREREGWEGEGRKGRERLRAKRFEFSKVFCAFCQK